MSWTFYKAIKINLTVFRGFYKTRWFIVPVVGLSLTYNIPKFFELKLIFAEEDPNMFEGLINHSAISSAEHQNIEQPFTHLEVRNITVDIVATDLRLNQVITLFIFQYFLNLIPYSTFTMMNVVECSFSRAYQKTT